MYTVDLWKRSEMEIAGLGVSVTYKGYYYLILAVVLCLKSGIRKASLSKEVYERIAELNEVSVTSVEKAIRLSLKQAWEDEDGRLRSSFPGLSKRPTNGRVIADITSRIRLETAKRI